jgi:hypothetical protein
MAYLRKYENKIAWVSATQDDMTCVTFHYLTTPTQEQIDADYNAYVEANEYNDTPQLTFGIDADIELLKDFVKYVKNHPAMTLTQYKTMLSVLPWYDADILRFFVLKVARGLAQAYGVDMEDFTETKVWNKVRNWLAETPAKKIAKVIWRQ